MAKTRYGDSFWLTQIHPKRRPAYPQDRGHINAEVAIIGGGMTGCSTAYGLVVAGASVVLNRAGEHGGQRGRNS
jgi:heterodisulfide reductase subunit A-like polyferredoxin